jgi:CRISPR type III-B/RAMP module RAMP protein Cmr6
MDNQESRQYYLPQSIAKLLTTDQLNRCKNLGLILDKYPPESAIQKSEGKGGWLKELAASNHVDVRLAESVYRRWINMITAREAIYFTAVTDWRMVVGLGGESILETDLTLHHLYGIPYIPGSALKGLTRGYVTGEVFPSKEIEQDNEEVKRIFGSQEHAGTVIFFDAMPMGSRIDFALDIMNSHYPNYYGEKKPPTNDQNPNPVTFLTVTDTTFIFALAPRRPSNEQDSKDVELAKGWLQIALEKYGVGGKTSAGYGFFRMVNDEATPERLAESLQTVSTPESTPSAAPKPIVTERIRPNIPKFREGQEITGSVVAPTDDLQRRAPANARAFLRYQSFATRDVLMVVSAEEAQNWKPGETRICVFEREEERDGCTVLMCQPRASKKKRG